MKLSLIALAISSAIVSSASFADDVTSVETIVVTAKRPNYKVDDTNTATLMDVSNLETPRQVNIIDKKLLDDLQATSLEKALANDASTIKTHESDGHENFYIRGFQLTTNEGYLRNGERKYSLIQEPVEMYETIEILKGPQGGLYGANGHGGVINMITKTPQAIAQTSLSQDIGSNNFYRTVVDTTGSASDNLRYRVIASKQAKDNWRHYKDGVHPKTERSLIALMLDYDISPETMLSLTFDHKSQEGHQDSGAYFDDNGNIVGDRDLILDMPWATNQKKEDSYGIKISHQFNYNWNLTGSYHYLDMANSARTSSIRLNDDSAQTGNYKFSTGQRDNSYDVHTAMLNLTGDLDALGFRHQLLIGANLVDHEYHRSSRWGGKKSDASIDPAKPSAGFDPSNMGKPSANDYPRQTYGVYLQDLMTFNDHWQFLAGIRYDLFKQNRTTNDKKEGTGEDRVYNNLIPNASLMFHPDSHSTVYLTYSQSFEPKSPIDSDRDANDGMERTPELGNLYELGYKHELFNQSLMFSTSVFQIKKENISVTSDYSDPKKPNVTRITTQGGQRIHTGVDASVTGRITSKLTAKAGAQYMQAQYKGQPKHDGKTPADIPEWTANLWANYELTDSIDLNSGLYYVGSRFGNDDNNQAKKPAYTLVDAGAIYRMPLENEKQLSFRFKVNNLLDKEYVTSGDYTGMSMGQGRNYMLSALYEF
ncbi:TonB-dependent receptor [Photobacterium swingsii]|uniref:TonB-dependent siderophore receptor n=1 Tax=Photobacterium swingsii TaxID=680026 RepID=A0A0J8V7U3_9GAMM|nr:TonB-dependent receptor [Photobacterium swingsii]KMV29296.1 TonB-dependent receptor [Photobacterium swingsii]PSW23035.1 TonB-dependent siderophore receptor [Photobacterium swingsii]